MKTFKTFINEARNPLRQQDPDIQAAASAYDEERKLIDSGKVLKAHTRVLKLQDELRDVKDRIESYNADTDELSLSQLFSLEKTTERLLDDAKDNLRMQLRLTQTLGSRLKKYEPGKKRTPIKPVYSKFGIKWYIYSMDRGKYFSFERQLPKLMALFQKSLDRRGLSKNPSVTFVARPINAGAVVDSGISSSGAAGRHFIEISPESFNVTTDEGRKEFIETLLHEYAHHIYKLLPYQLKKQDGPIVSFFNKQMDEYKAASPAGTADFESIGKYFGHSSEEGYAYTNPEELFTSSFEHYPSLPKQFQTFVKSIYKYI